MKGSYKFFSNRDCQYFPCHKVQDEEKFNCLFCYCPLYALGEDCGGNFRYAENDVKDCSACLIPHSPGGYDYINGKFNMIKELARPKADGEASAEGQKEQPAAEGQKEQPAAEDEAK